MKAKKKDPPKSKRGEKRIQRAVEQRRERLRDAAPEVYTNLSEAYETPEGLPSLEDFAVQRDVNRAYGEAHPMEGATKMVDLGPLMFERWLGRKSSEDGVNYRAPYYRPGDPNAEMANIMQSGRTSADPFTETFGGSKNNPTVLADDSTVRKYKPAHKEFQTNKPLGKDILGTIGSVFPPANFLLQGGASIGGRQIPEALAVPAVVGLMKKAFSYGDRDRSSIDESNQDALKSMPPAAAGLGLGMTALAGTLGDVVVPTSGIGLNPFMREARQIRKETKKDVKNIAEAKSRDMEGKSGRMDAITKRETADVDRLIRLYEKKYGVKVNRKETAPTTYQSFMGGGIMKVKKK
jgi:hypothetical protein